MYDCSPSNPETALSNFFLHFWHAISTFKTVLCTIELDHQRLLVSDSDQVKYQLGDGSLIRQLYELILYKEDLSLMRKRNRTRSLGCSPSYETFFIF